MNLLNKIRSWAGLDTYEDNNELVPDPVENEITERGGVFSTHFLKRSGSRVKLAAAVFQNSFQRTTDNMGTGQAIALDDAGIDLSGIKSAYRFQSLNITDNQLAYFGSQGFIGYQLMAILAQNWLISKACKQPADDAVRKGYKITIDDGKQASPEVMALIAERDDHYALTRNLVDFVYWSRVFGIRIAKFDVASADPDYYEKPFNPDGITAGSYRGITQIDPYWITPELNGDAASNPDSKHFYEPTFWRVNGKRIHRTHLIIAKGPDVADILKPTYLYGGLSVTQMIFERVYAAERTANEAPMLAQSKRETVLHVDVEAAVANQAQFEEKMGVWTEYRNNFGVKVVGTEETIEQFETSLADLDAVIMTQYQLVASIAGVPVTKLLGTVPKGFNSTGEYDEASYHETLESIQAHDLTRLIKRHHLCVMRSDVAQKYPNLAKARTSVVWNKLDALTEKEQAEINKLKADTGTILVQSGAIDGADERDRLIADPASGYTGLLPAEPELPDDDEGEPQI